LLGVHGIVKAPGVLVAVSPLYAFDFLIHRDFHISFAVLGRSLSRGDRRRSGCMPTWAISAGCPIRLAWFAVALPGLVLNYFGQAALRNH